MNWWNRPLEWNTGMVNVKQLCTSYINSWISDTDYR